MKESSVIDKKKPGLSGETGGVKDYDKKPLYKETSFIEHIRKHVLLYVMIIPGFLYFIMFFLVPIAGNFIAFMDYNYIMGITKSKWVGFKHFNVMFHYPEFYRILRNTMVIGGYSLLFKYPAPLILALILNEIRLKWFKKLSQTLIFIPYFLSWIIVARLVNTVLDPGHGLLNIILKSMGHESIWFMAKSSLFPIIVSLASVWRDSGFGCIIYLAALTAIDPELYEAARIDGANKLQQMLYITIPLLVPTMLVLLLVNIGQFLNTGYNQIESMYTPLVRETGEILVNYTYRVGIQSGKFSFATAIGLFQALVGVVLVLGGNRISLALTGRGLVYAPPKEKK
jgi:putative aldouronate transport system permease protein